MWIVRLALRNPYSIAVIAATLLIMGVINPENNVNYQVVTKLPVRELASVNDLLNLPIHPVTSQVEQKVVKAGLPRPQSQALGNLSTIESVSTSTQINHSNVQRVLDVLANVEGRDLAGVITDIRATLKSLGKLPGDLKIKVMGQNEVIESSFEKLGLGMVLAALMVYILLVTLFQSWLDPALIMLAVPGSICGILWALTQSRSNEAAR